MKAAVLYGNEDIRYDEISEPLITKDNQVKIKIAFAGICGSDIPRVLNNGAHYYPIVLGHECSGVVCETGSEVKSCKVGDHAVIAPLIPCMECEDCKNGNYSLCKKYTFVGSRLQGAFGEYVTVPEQNVIKIDDNIPLKYASFFEPSTVALHGIYQSGLVASDNKKVCVIGTGTIGQLTLLWLKALGIGNVDVFGRGDKGIELAKKNDANLVYCTKDSDLLEQVKMATSARGYDYVFECVGSEQTIELSFSVASNKANVCLIGTPASNIQFSKAIWENINRKELTVKGSWMSYSSPFPGKEWLMTEKYLSSGLLKISDDMIGGIYPIENAKDAFELYKNSSSIRGRVLLKHRQ